MDIEEYDKVKDMTYLQYCDYLQDKYGMSPINYCKSNFHKNNNVTRTKWGLFVHHKYENHAILLSVPGWMENNPYEYQLKENLVYCNFLEHLFLHILITEYPEPDDPEEIVGSGGVHLIMSNLIDFWSFYFLPGLVEKYRLRGPLPWQQICFDAIKGNIDVFFELCNRCKCNNMITELKNAKNFDEINKSLQSVCCNIDSLKKFNDDERIRLAEKERRQNMTQLEKDRERRANMASEQKACKLELQRKRRSEKKAKIEEIRANK